MRSVVFVLAASFTLLAVGCGSDKTVDQYQREKAQKNLSVFQAVSGTYTGTVVSAKTGKNMGALQLDLSADTTTSGSTSGDTAVGTPVLVTNVRYLDKTVINFTVPSSFYDQDTGAYSAQISIERAGAAGSKETVIVAIRGTLRGDQISGQIGAFSDTRASGVFSLVKNGPSLAEAAKGGTAGDLDPIGTIRTYKGTGNVAGKARDFYLQVSKPSKGPKQDFVDVFYPDAEKVVSVSLQISEAVSVVFTDIKWDSTNGIIQGTSSGSASGGYTNYLNCSGFFFTQQSKSFECNYYSSRSPAIPLTFEP